MRLAAGHPLALGHVAHSGVAAAGAELAPAHASEADDKQATDAHGLVVTVSLPLSIRLVLVRLLAEEDDMQFLLMIYSNEREFRKVPETEMLKMMGEYGALTQSLKESGHYVGGNRLELTSTARSVRVRDGKPLVTDGPFAETKEQLAGYYLVEAHDIEEAIKVAARIPGARVGTIEVRAIAAQPPART
jgi:hypothetical protein